MHGGRGACVDGGRSAARPTGARWRYSTIVVVVAVLTGPPALVGRAREREE